MPHPYPAHDSRLPDIGKDRYFLTFSTDQRTRVFVDDPPVSLVRTQILRAAREIRFEIDAYCFMPDHLHLIARGSDETSDAKDFVKRAKQYSGYYFKKEYGLQLWQRYGYERVIREDVELALTIRYIVENPVQAGLVEHPAKYRYLGTQRYTVEELLAVCEYSGSSA